MLKDDTWKSYVRIGDCSPNPTYFSAIEPDIVVSSRTDLTLRELIAELEYENQQLWKFADRVILDRGIMRAVCNKYSSGKL